MEFEFFSCCSDCFQPSCQFFFIFLPTSKRAEHSEQCQGGVWDGDFHSSGNMGGCFWYYDAT